MLRTGRVAWERNRRAWNPRNRRFKSCQPHHKFLRNLALAETNREFLRTTSTQKASDFNHRQVGSFLGYFESEKHVTFCSNLPDTAFLPVCLCRITQTVFKPGMQTDVRKNGCALSG